MNIGKLRKMAGREEIDYQFLLSALSAYAYPRDKISTWLKSGELIRVKKGLYIFGKDSALHPHSKEVLANLIYGPSAISLSYALSFYGIIPERATQVTSITNKRNKLFNTPAGQFSYHYLNNSKYSIGLELSQASKNSSFLIASPEKALCDHIHLTDKVIKLINFSEIEAYLLYDLRIDDSFLLSLQLTQLKEICLAYKDPRLNLLLKFIQQWKQNNA